MRNPDLAADYVHRAGIRLLAIDVLFEGESWTDVVHESQKVVELALKGLLREQGIEAPRIYDVSGILLDERSRLPAELGERVDELARISKQLRRDRELSFDGTEDLIPSDFYSREDATSAREGARTTV